MLNLKKLLTKTLQAIPVGRIDMYAGSTAPSGWLLCNGQAVSRTTYSALFAVIGTTYGTGDGSTTFNLPDMSGRMPIGASSTYALNANGGDETVTLTAAQSGLKGHGHTYTRPTVSSSGTCSITSSGGHTHTVQSKYRALKVGTSTSYNFWHNDGTAGTGNLSPGISSDTGKHTHTVPNHTHTLSGGSVADVSDADASDAHNNMPPYRALNFIIYAGE